MLNGFKEFIMRGNVVELAVAVVIGTAFTALVTAVVDGILTPLVAAIFGSPDLSQAGAFVVNNANFYPGLVLDAIVKFLMIAAAVYFLIVLPLNKLAERRKRGIEPEPEKPAEDVLLLQEIRDLLAAQGQAGRSGSGLHASPGTGWTSAGEAPPAPPVV
ncbi:large conductance mechanosensitive channel protein MscL [Cellulomonas fimi]|uniref:Large-conductance mechanosensitive channel n=1 Tax=Cellulomonas fimi TaxID=1708 RepID=A0A7Y0QIU7_CELFI|nr:large conductance mechanosensitive channel protein MscL [Cellulomonas fimi]NMR20672.1 large conductance mechanosensitive channel protein MscL [Cellulomonas fimi]